MNSMHDFYRDKQRAVEQLREMNNRASQNAEKAQAKTPEYTPNRAPFLSPKLSFSLSDDDLLFIGLIMILSKDCHDTWLFLALFYIFS